MKYFLLSITLFFISGCHSVSRVAPAPQEKFDLEPNHQEIENEISNKELDTSNKTASELKTKTELNDEKLAILSPCLIEQDQNDPQAYSDVWQRIKNQLTLNVPNNKRIQAEKNWYLKHPEYAKRISQRATPYLFHIVERLEQKNIPIEFALLPIVESAFDPFAYSHGRASGMWQFIPSTGKRFGLKQNWWYDGRRDIYASTEAAIKLLTYLNKRFDGNWLYALAAYNSGEGNVSRAIKRNKKRKKPTDFWSLKLPKETLSYVPKLLALADIIANLNPNDENWLPIKNLPYFDRVETGTQIDLSLAASLADIPMDEFYTLNPGFNQWATAPKGPHHILLPLEKIASFKKNLTKIPKKERISFKQYKIKSGDSLSTIAAKFSTSVQLLKENNDIRNNTIRAGKKLLIPVASNSRDKYFKSNEQRLLSLHDKKRKGNKLSIKVKNGDSFWDLSRKHKVNIRSLAKWNNMAPTDTLRVGQKLVVWSKNNNHALSERSIKTKKIFYTARKGDSFAKIANKFKVSLASVKNWNKKVARKKYLQPGDSVTLYVDITQQF